MALAAGDTGTSEGREALLHEVGPVVRALPEGILQQELVRIVAGALGLDDALMRQSLFDAARAPRRPVDGGPRRRDGGHGGRPWREAGGPRRGGDRPGVSRSGGPGHPGGAPGRPAGAPAGAGAGAGAPPVPAAPAASGAADPGGLVATDDFGRLDDHGGGPSSDADIDALINADPGRDDGPAGSAAPVAPAAPPDARAPVPAARDGARPAAPGPTPTIEDVTPRRPPSNPALAALERRAEIELAFLALCVALPGPGAARLAELDLDSRFSGATIRRAAAHLREHAANPSSGLPPGDPALASLVAELVARAGRFGDRPEPAELDRASLMLELARLDRDIAAARATQSPLSDLAAERQRVLGEIRKVAR